MANCFGGASGEETGLEANTSALDKTLQANYTTEFADQQEALGQLNSEIQQIRSGQTGPGFSADELAARTGEIVNTAGAASRNAAQAVANQSAGQQFGGKQDESGLARANAIRQQITGEIASGAETQKANALENLTAANYAQGRENAARTAAGLEALSGAYGGAASGALGGALNAGQQAFGEAKTINEQNQQASAMLGGLLKAGVGLGGTFLSGGLAGGAGVGDFLKGGLGALTGQDLFGDQSQSG